MVAHRRLAGVDDLFTARAAIRRPDHAGCGVVAHIDSSEPMQNLHSCFLIDIILNFIIIIIIII